MRTGGGSARPDPAPSIPDSTYRLQITPRFTLHDAADLVPYLHALGVSHLYSSPILRARAGSEHGYDVIDPGAIDPQRGGEEGFAALSAALAEHGMGLLLDVVPNHMAASPENPWWRDLLARGPASPHARVFDVDWEAPGLEGKVLLPVLGEPYGEALERGDLQLVLEGGEASVAYHEHRFPLSPETAAEAEVLASHAGSPGHADALDRVLARQRYRLAWWRLGSEHLDYRRFFDVHELAGVRVEDPAVLEETHRRVLELWRSGRLHGLRIDHVDGLRDPEGYLRRLRDLLTGAVRGDADAAVESPYVVVEKILAGDEELPDGWACHGTTGYEAMNAINGLFVEPAGLAALDRVYRARAGVAERFPAMRAARKRQVLAELFGAEVGRLVRALADLAAAHRVARDLPLASLRDALVEVTACLPVYRTYADERGPSAADAARLDQAFAQARGRADTDPVLPRALDFLEQVLHLRPPPELAARRGEWLDFVRLWQQTSGAVTAKGLEDTALYVHARLIALNDVGGEPPGIEPPGNAGAFHERNRRRRERWPAALTCTSTHDSKRSEDVAARIDVLSEIPAEWEKRLARWTELAAPHRRALADGRVAPDATEELFLYQTLLGAWPLAEEEWPPFVERMEAYVRKALREAKRSSSWLAPDEAYEEAAIGFARELLEAGKESAFLTDFRELVERVAPFGAWGSLAQLVLKVASPGVPDFYQGTELWDLSLVDPDNRRAVDFARRRELLAELQRRHREEDRAALLAALLAEWRDGRVKLYTTWRALEARRADPELFLRGDYQVVTPEGARARNQVAFARRHEGRWLLAVVPRWLTGIVGAQQPPVGASVWADTWLPLPEGAPARWRDAIGEGACESEGGRLTAGSVLAAFPVALLVGRERPGSGR